MDDDVDNDNGLNEMIKSLCLQCQWLTCKKGVFN